MANNIPPMGALKPAATPAATPSVVKALLINTRRSTVYTRLPTQSKYRRLSTVSGCGGWGRFLRGSDRYLFICWKKIITFATYGKKLFHQTQKDTTIIISDPLVVTNVITVDLTNVPAYIFTAFLKFCFLSHTVIFNERINETPS